MFLGKQDRRVIRAFVERKPLDGHKLTSHYNGDRLSGYWLGGNGIAEWKGDRIVFHDLGSKAAQTVQSAVKKAAAPRDLASRSATRKRPAARTRRDAPKRRATQATLYEVWSSGDRAAHPYSNEAPMFIAVYKDKGEALARAKRLTKSNRGYTYEVRRVAGRTKATRQKRFRTAAWKKGYNARDPGGPGKYIVKISNSPRYKGEYSGGRTLAEAIVEARTFKGRVGPGATIAVGTFTFGKGDPEDGRWHVSRVIQRGE